MGSLGESFALSAYEGIHALDRFWNIQDHEGSIDPSYILTIPHIMISLDEPGIIEPEQWGIMKKADVNTNKDSIPVFRKIIPGFFPQIPDINSLKDIKCARRAGCGKVVLVRTGHGGKTEKLCRDADVKADHVADDLMAAVKWIIDK